MSDDPVLRYCGRCGAGALRFDGEKAFVCRECGWLFYRNPAAACVAVLRHRERGVLFVRRAREPGTGLLDLPGGFVDAGESAEDALRRELREELGVMVDALRYLGSQPNVYPFSGIDYHTVDLFFEADLAAPEPPAFDRDEILALEFLAPAEVPLDQIALPSIRAGVEQWVVAPAQAGTPEPTGRRVS